MDCRWYMPLIEFYERHLAYRYWNWDLQKMAYRHLGFSEWWLLFLFFLIHAAVLNAGFLALWAVLRVLMGYGILAESKYRFAAKCLKVLIAFGCFAAMHFTNNLWVEIAN
jgi:hypothetical protein